MRSLSADTLAALSARELRIVQVILMQFTGLTVALNSSNRDLTFSGFTSLGAAGLGTISPINDSPGEIKGLQFTMSGVPSEYLALALDDAAIVQGAQTTIFLAILNEAGAVIEAPVDWSGRLDKMTIEENGDTCTVTANAESSAVDLLHGNALTTSNADQQFLYPGDRAFEYVSSQEQPVVWPTKQLFIASQ
jgi:hypothetical protein